MHKSGETGLRKLCLTVLLIASGNCVFAEASLQGVWEVVETSNEAGESVSDDGPNLLIFTRGYFSKLETLASRIHVSKPAGAPLTAEEKVSAYDTYRSNAGSYEATESTIVFHTQVVRSPRAAAVGWTYAVEYRLDGESLILIETTPRGLETTTYSRLE
jgi:hypothetical protein